MLTLRARLMASRKGFSVTEVLVAVSIVGLLISIALPGIQYARTVSRITTCKNHERQLGLALASFESSHKVFPTALTRLPEFGYLRLLPYLEADYIRRDLLAMRSPPTYFIETMLCPDDSEASINMRYGESNYYFSKGTSFFATEACNGFFSSGRIDTAVRDISDGLSQTVAMSERLVRPMIDDKLSKLSQRDFELDQRRYFWWTSTQHTGRGEELLAVDECKSHRTTMTPQNYGLNMLNYRYGGCYDHLMPPNSCSCYNGPEDFDIDFSASLAPASSNHPGGVNSLLADGSVRFISDQIDSNVWRALGTRRGSEQVSSEF